jgi:hypothetical protein
LCPAKEARAVVRCEPKCLWRSQRDFGRAEVLPGAPACWWRHQSTCGGTRVFVEEPKYVWRSQRACRGTQGASGGAQSSCEGTSVLVEKRNVAASYGLQAITCILCAVAISFGVPLKGFLASVPPPPLATSSLSAMAHSTCNGCCTPRLALKVRPRRQRRLRHVRR